MNELAKMALERKSVAFVLGIGTIVALRVTGHIDVPTFGSCFQWTMTGFMAAVAYQEKNGG